MNLDAKIAIKMEEAKQEIVELFQDATSTDADLHRKLNYLVDTVPLLEDVKTEVSAVERMLRQFQIPEDKEEDDSEDPADDYKPLPYSPEVDDPALPELIDRVLKAIGDAQQVQKLLEDGRNLPSKDLRNIPWITLLTKAVDLGYKLKQYQDIIIASNNRKIDNATSEEKSFAQKLKDDLANDVQTIKELTDQLISDIQDGIDAIQGKADENELTTLEKLREILNLDEIIKGTTDDIKTDTGEILDDTGDIKDDLSQMGQDMSSCCENMDRKSDRNYNAVSDVKSDTSYIKNAVDMLQPTTQANQSLAAVQKLNNIMNNLEYIRGLL